MGLIWRQQHDPEPAPAGLGLPPIGVDDVFVFINTYRQATHLEDPQLRMIHTIQTAGKATFFTSLTTAAAYAANVFSQVRDCLCPWPSLSIPPMGPGLCSSHSPLLLQPYSLCLKAPTMSLDSVLATGCHYQNFTNGEIMKMQIVFIINAH